MYIPKDFELRDRERLLPFLQENSFAAIISVEDNQPVISHLPLVVCAWGEYLVAEGHLALANAHHRLLRDGRAVTVIFSGPHGYVSSSVYHHHNVPTWNYQVAHGTGKVESIDRNSLEKHLSELVDQYESQRDHPLKYTDFSKQMIEEYLQEIVGFRIVFHQWQMAEKLSQNRDEQDFRSIVNDLERQECPHLLAQAMKNNRQ